MFSGGIEEQHRTVMGQSSLLKGSAFSKSIFPDFTVISLTLVLVYCGNKKMVQQIKEKKHGLHVFILLELEYVTYKVSMVAVSEDIVFIDVFL